MTDATTVTGLRGAARTVAVTGATGGLGSRVASMLAALGVQQRLVVRDPTRIPAELSALAARSAQDRAGSATIVAGTYADTGAMRTAFAGTDSVFLVSGREAPDRLQQHYAVVDAAAAAGVSRLVYTSYLGAAQDATFTLARDHYRTEEHIKASGIAYTFLRDSLYLDFLPLMLWEDQAIRGPGGDGRVACVSRDDVADVAVAVLAATGPSGAGPAGTEHDGATYNLTGPRALSLAEIAAGLARHSGRPITYQPETVEQARASRASYRAPDWMLDGWVTMYTSIAAGELDLVTTDIEQVTGHPAQSLDDYLSAHPLV
jgi:NAD(P)H dehydrogenase (quinone)